MFSSIVGNLKRTLEDLDREIKEREASGRKCDSDLIRITAIKKLSDYLYKLSSSDISYREKRASREIILDWIMRQAPKIDVTKLQREISEKFVGEKDGEEDLEREMLKYMRTPERSLDSLVGLKEEMEWILDRIVATIKHGPGSSDPLPGLDNPYKI